MAGGGARGAAVLTAIAGVCLAAGAARAVPVTYDVAKDFSITSGNPHGAWTYGWEAPGGSTLTTYAAAGMNSTHQYWLGNLTGDGNPSISKNISAVTILGVAPGHAALHPGPSAQPSIARWTAPSSSSIAIDGQFLAGDWGQMQVGIFLNNDWVTPLFHAVDAGVFHLARFVSAGDTIDFAVYGGYGYGTTPLDAVITADVSSVPEIDPAGMGSVLALVTGALGLVERRRLRGA